MRLCGLLVFTCLILGLSKQAFANDYCPPLTLVTSVDMQTDPDNGLAFVPAKINGTPKSMIVDTGGFFTQIAPSVVDELKIPTRHSNMELVGVAGDTTNIVAHTSLTLGNLHADDMDFMVMSGAWKFGPEIGGILAPNLLRAYDADFDFANKKFNLISQKHCDGKVVYWPADSVAVIPIVIDEDGHIMVPVELDGKKLTAMLDTGSNRSILNLESAVDDFGLKPGTADTPQTGHLPGMAKSLTYRHRFKTLSLEGLNISNPDFDLIPDLMRNKLKHPNDSLVGDTRLPVQTNVEGLGDIVLGMDVLHRLHLYIAYKEKKLYITPASASESAGPTTDATASQSASH